MRLLVTCFVFIAANSLIHSQELVGSGGDFSTNGTETLSWSLGEISTTTSTVAPNTLTQGFQQVDRSDVNVEELFDAHISVYPIPFQSTLTIQTDELNGIYATRIYSSAGQLAYEGPEFNGESNNVSLDLSSLDNGMYILLIENQANGKQFFRRIIKT